MARVIVELFGIPRARAGIAATEVVADRLGDVFVDLGRRFPGLAAEVVDGRRLRPGFTANLGGQRFVTDPETPLHDGDTALLMSLDAGG